MHPMNLRSWKQQQWDILLLYQNIFWFKQLDLSNCVEEVVLPAILILVQILCAEQHTAVSEIQLAFGYSF